MILCDESNKRMRDCHRFGQQGPTRGMNGGPLEERVLPESQRDVVQTYIRYAAMNQVGRNGKRSRPAEAQCEGCRDCSAVTRTHPLADSQQQGMKWACVRSGEIHAIDPFPSSRNTHVD